MPQGSGRMSFKATDVSQLANSKRSLIRIDNSTDSMSLARSFVVGRCKVNQNSTPEWKTRWNTIRQSKNNLQTLEAKTLLSQVGIGMHQPCGIEEYKKVQDHLPNSMKPAQREQFLAWYNEQKDKVFDFQHEMEKYCKSDVDI
ncbi:hypothetical protein ACF0H5_012243 [Mactra antiquata]